MTEMVVHIDAGPADVTTGWCWTCMLPSIAEGPVYAVSLTPAGVTRNQIGRWRLCTSCGAFGAARP